MDLIEDYLESLYCESLLALKCIFEHFGVNHWRKVDGSRLCVYTVHQMGYAAVLGKKYKNDYPSSEEEIWIPIRMKK
jgi:hypothetical protein